MIAVAVVFISMKQELDLRSIGRYCDSLVGLFMIVLGAIGVLSAIRSWREKIRKSDDDLTDFRQSSIFGNEATQIDDSNHVVASIAQTHVDVEAIAQHNTNSIESGWSELILEDNHIDCFRCLPFLDMRDPFTQKVISFTIGMLHGIAGPGGVLGVLPAVEMQNWRASTVYLGSFVISSTLSMGAFAALYGEVTKRIGATQFIFDFALRIFSSVLSIAVGAVWVVLSILGKMEDFFH